MIQANELRIGNLFQAYEINKNNGVEFFKVEQLIKNQPDGKVGVSFRNGSCWSLEVEPIPLTEEILLRCGFVKVQVTDKGYSYVKELEEGYKLVITQYHKVSPFVFQSAHTITQLKYVHQLQNLYFALTQKELEINL